MAEPNSEHAPLKTTNPLAWAILGLFAALTSACVEEKPEQAGGTPEATSRYHLVDRVTRVRDGDTIVVGSIPIRIANLNCAESGTWAGERATQRMRALVQARTLGCRMEGRRSYDREVGVCDLQGVDIGEIMISGGYCRRWR